LRSKSEEESLNFLRLPFDSEIMPSDLSRKGVPLAGFDALEELEPVAGSAPLGLILRRGDPREVDYPKGCGSYGT